MVYIEFLVFIIVALLFFIWFIWLKLSKKYHNWRYNEKNDRGKIGEEHRQELLKAGRSDPVAGVRREISRSTETVNSSARQGEFEGRELFPSTTSYARREESNSGRRTSNGTKKLIRNPFRKRK